MFFQIYLIHSCLYPGRADKNRFWFFKQPLRNEKESEDFSISR